MRPIMTPPDDAVASRGRRRSHHACLTCRRKKTRCPGEKPACSSCSRLSQPCSYPAVGKPSKNERSEERLAHLEEKLDLLLSGGLTNTPSHPDTTTSTIEEEIPDASDKSFSASPPAPESSKPASNHPSAVLFDSEDSNLLPGRSDIQEGISLYFKFCHRQPIWCFERDQVAGTHSGNTIPEELSCSILALTSRFSEKRDQLQLYGETAKTLIMLRIANGSVELTTIESLCLLSYSSFIDGNFQLGQFHLGLAFQLCRSAMLDLEVAYAQENRTTERKKRLFWSLQLLELFYGRQTGLLSVPGKIWWPSYSSTGPANIELDPTSPPLPHDELGTSAPNEPGIWNTSVHLAWVWSQVRKYVSNCSHNILKEPWRNDSMYAKVLSDFMETENRIPICHRYDTAKFYKRKVDEFKVNRDYWAPWLKEQFTYHAIQTVLNHPFLYIIGAQHNPNLAIPNTFWRRSSELALLHATWIVRMIDMVVDKQVPLADPFFGHVAAIAATVHLYYCCAAAIKLKHKSNTDFAKCRRFLKGFLFHSAACASLDRNLDKMTQMAAGPEGMDTEDWMPSKIYLSVPLMWKILQFNSTEVSPDGTPTDGLLDSSLAPHNPNQDETDESSTIEIIVATSPEITINTADGGQEAPTFSSYKGPVRPPRDPSWNSVRSDRYADHNTDALSLNFTPWLYADSVQLANLGDMGYDGSQGEMPEDRGGMAWWEGENFSNIMFSHF